MNRPTPTTSRFLPALALLPFLAAPAFAQFESPLLSKVQPNLVNPGGKSLAMGGAFVSVADDSTAAFANPAGLPQLGTWQLGASGKGFDFRPTLSTDNYFESTPGNFSLTSRESYQPKGTSKELEYAALVVPVVTDVTLAVYRAVNLRFELDGNDLVGGNFRSFSINRQASVARSIDEQGGLDLRNELYGASVGARFGAFSVGAGVTLNRLRFDFTGNDADPRHLFVVNDANGSRVLSDFRFVTAVSTDVESGTKAGFVVGARLELAEAMRLAVGAVYRKSPRFDVGYNVFATRTFDAATIANFRCGIDDPLIPFSGASACGSFKVPDDFAVGISGMPFPNLLVSVEVQRIKYSEFNDGFVPLFVYCTNPLPTGCPVEARAVARGEADDGTLPRFGAEYTFTAGSSTEINLRAGYYREPAHGMRLVLYPDADRNRRADAAPAVEVTNPPLSQAYRTAFDGGTPDDHVSVGLGATFGRTLSLDLAYDVGKASRQFVASAFFRF